MKKAILIVLLTLFVLLMGFSPMLAAAVPSQEQQNREVVKKVFAIFKTRGLDLLDNLMDKDEVTSGRSTEGTFVELQKGKQRATMIAIKSMALAIRSYIIDHNKAPEAKTVAELQPLLSRYYIKILPLKDAWENEILYKVDPGEPGKYWIGSPGNDGKFEGFDQEGTWKLEASEKGQDIVLANGDFTYKPDLEEKK